MREPLHRSWALWAAILGGWTVLSLFFVPELYLYFAYQQQRLTWRDAATLTLANTAIAAAFVPFIVWLTRRFPFSGGRWPRSLAVHIPACLVFSLAHSGLYVVLCYASPVFHLLFTRFQPNVLTYWAVVGFTEAFVYFQKYKERDRELAHAQLRLLKTQLHPHFLFNALNTVSAMVQEDPPAAQRAIARLSDLLRMTLDNIGRHEVALRQEIDFVERYLEIERLRFSESLALEWQAEPAELDALVPSMILQPLVENSIRHGFGTQVSTGRIRIEARHRDHLLSLTVADNGRGFGAPAAARSRGLGLSNLKRRLEQLYPARHRLELGGGLQGGATVTIEIPFRTASAESAAAAAGFLLYENPSADSGRRTVGAEADRRPTQA